ncbi:hypothetical protein [Trinickia fusca]|uniref:Uncharacterized protein n=1 Tax=Trinickia fusca TaxID=2419777 RepID=A0A494WXI1_9BURK|nr:hypothetical protein [Trinickia fusca]RKP43267.1 hypothetical protein D7S89_26955 [Trinickia fusca]
MLEKILEGESPSKVFRSLIEADPSIGNLRLGELLSDEFVNLSSEAQQLVWHWKGPGKSQGLSDEDLDALLKDLFGKAGYL